MSEELNLRQAAERLIYWSNRIAAATTDTEENECCNERDKLFAVFRKVDAERLTAPTPAGEHNEAIEAARRIVDWDDNGRLADDEWLVERNETAIIAICRALLSSPRVEEVRREAIKDAIQAVGESAWKHLGGDAYSRGMDLGATQQLNASLKALRSLSPTDKQARG